MVIAGHETQKQRSYLNVILVVLTSNCYSWLFITAANGKTKRRVFNFTHIHNIADNKLFATQKSNIFYHKINRILVNNL